MPALVGCLCATPPFWNPLRRETSLQKWQMPSGHTLPAPLLQLLLAPQHGGVCQEASPNLGGLDDEGERQLAVPVCPAGASLSGLDGGGVYQVSGQKGATWERSAISPATAETEPPLFSPHLSHPFWQQPCLITCSLCHHSPPRKRKIVGNISLSPRARIPWPGLPLATPSS